MEPNIKLCVGPPSDFSEAERAAFIDFVYRAETVARGPIQNLVPRAVSLAMLYCDSNLIGSAGLKRPNDPYKKGVFKKAGADSPTNFSFELGWVQVDDTHRGKKYATKLASAVFDRAGDKGIYATTHDPYMSRILIHHGFTETGAIQV